MARSAAERSIAQAEPPPGAAAPARERIRYKPWRSGPKPGTSTGTVPDPITSADEKKAEIRLELARLSPFDATARRNAGIGIPKRL